MTTKLESKPVSTETAIPEIEAFPAALACCDVDIPYEVHISDEDSLVVSEMYPVYMETGPEIKQELLSRYSLFKNNLDIQHFIPLSDLLRDKGVKLIWRNSNRDLEYVDGSFNILGR